jgi:hypothetical protein
VSGPPKIDIKPYSDSPEHRAAEVYRGIEIDVLYCYLANPTSRKIPEETLGWRYFLPDASYWMYKFATPDEAFLKGRETVDLRLQQGTLEASNEPKPEPPTPSEVPNHGTESEPASPVKSPLVPEREYGPLIKIARPRKWKKRASWGLGVATLEAASAILQQAENSRCPRHPLVRLRVRTNSGVEVPVGQSTGCP